MVPTVDFDPFSREVLADPYPAYRRLRGRSRVSYNPQRDLWFIPRYDDVQAAFRDHETFSSAAGVDLDNTGSELIGRGNFNGMDPPMHTAFRNVLRSHFTAPAIGRYEAAVRADTQTLIDRLPASGEVDIASHFSWRLPAGMVSRILGFDPDCRDELVRLFRIAFRRIPGEPHIPRIARDAASSMRRIITHQANARRKHPKPDLLSELVAARVMGRPLREEAIGACFLLFAAGVDTTASLLSNSLLQLSLRPDQRRQLVRDPSMHRGAVEELLRFESPVQNEMRTTTRTVQIGGVAIPAGERVALLIGSANRDERTFEHADRLDVTRPPKRHLAFGNGIHFCLGNILARLEGRIALPALLERLDSYEVVGPVVRSGRVNERQILSLPIGFAPRGKTPI
jgi:cytochrome P450